MNSSPPTPPLDEDSSEGSPAENLRSSPRGLPEVTPDDIDSVMFKDLIDADTTVNLIQPSEIVVPNEYLHPDEEVMPLVASMRRVGPLVALIIAEDNELVSGAKRYQAAVILNLPFVPVRKMKLSPYQRVMVRIIDNEQRRNLSFLEQIENAMRAKHAYELEHPSTKRGGAPGVAGGGKQPAAGVLSFVKFFAPHVGRSPRTITDQIRIGNALSQDVRDMIRQTELASDLSELKALADMTPEQQLASIQAVWEGQAPSIKKWRDKALKLGAPAAARPATVSGPPPFATRNLNPTPLGKERHVLLIAGSQLDLTTWVELGLLHVARIRDNYGDDEEASGRADKAESLIQQAEQALLELDEWVVQLRGS